MKKNKEIESKGMKHREGAGTVAEPTATNSERELQEQAGRFSGLYRWLFHPKQKRFLLPATGVWILALDWLLFSSNALTALTATPVVMAVGFVLGSIGAYLIQRRGAKDAQWKAALKAVLAGLVVGLPLPVGGTIIGGWVLLFSGLGNAKKEILN
jgi:hypothetical protein